jgi:hypothetical protein
MTVSNQSIFVSGFQTLNWRPWVLDDLGVFARVSTIRFPNSRDFAGVPLPPTPELTEIVSGLQAYYRVHIAGGLGEPFRQSVLTHIGDAVNAGVERLHKRGLDLLWRIEPKPDAPAEGSTKLNAALAIDRRP